MERLRIGCTVTDLAKNLAEMRSWISSTAINDAAVAIRQDSATFATSASRIDPVWRNLSAYFDLHNANNGYLYSAGSKVTEYGNNVKDGVANVAKYLEDCAQQIKSLEDKRDGEDGILARADRLLAEKKVVGPPATISSPNQSTQMCVPETPEERYKRLRWPHLLSELDDVSVEASSACSKYKGVFADVANDIRVLDNDGSTSNPWLGQILDSVITIAAFIPPVSGIAAGAAIIRAYQGAYDKRRRELMEQHPEMTDSAIAKDAAKGAAVRATPQVALSVVTSKVGSAAAGAVVTKKTAEIIGDGAGEITSTVVSMGVGDVPAEIGEKAANSVGISTQPSSSQDVGPVYGPPATTGPELPPDPPFSKSAEEAKGRQEDPDWPIKTKDFDGDGYTDPEFLPDSDEVKNDKAEVADVVVAPPPEAPTPPASRRDNVIIGAR